SFLSVLVGYGFATFNPRGIPEIAKHRSGARKFGHDEVRSFHTRLFGIELAGFLEFVHRFEVGESLCQMLLDRIPHIVEPVWWLDLASHYGSFHGSVHVGGFVSAMEGAIFCVVLRIRGGVQPTVVLNA